MNLKRACIAISFLIIISAGAQTALCENGMYLNLCQELVNSARSYEARASYHGRMAKTIQMQIEGMARLPKSDLTSQQIDTFFSQYDENRVMEAKYRELFRQANEEAKKCMKSAE
jgi:hypothetical protein